VIEPEYTIEGLEDLIRGFERGPEIATEETAKAIERLLLVLQGKLAVYPAGIVGSRYRRTGTLGRLWTSGQRVVERATTPAGLVVEGRIGNATPYARQVQAEGEQRAVHVGRWETAEAIVAASEGEAERLMGDAGRRTVDRIAEGG